MQEISELRSTTDPASEELSNRLRTCMSMYAGHAKGFNATLSKFFGRPTDEIELVLVKTIKEVMQACRPQHGESLTEPVADCWKALKDSLVNFINPVAKRVHQELSDTLTEAASSLMSSTVIDKMKAFCDSETQPPPECVTSATKALQAAGKEAITEEAQIAIIQCVKRMLELMVKTENDVPYNFTITTNLFVAIAHHDSIKAMPNGGIYLEICNSLATCLALGPELSNKVDRYMKDNKDWLHQGPGTVMSVMLGSPRT